MNEKQTDVKKVSAQPEMIPAIINWALWPLWIFASMTVCGTAGSLLIRLGGYDLIATMIALGGFFWGDCCWLNALSFPKMENLTDEVVDMGINKFCAYGDRRLNRVYIS